MSSEEEFRRFLARKYLDCLEGNTKNNLNTTINETLTCPWVFDGYLCWSETSAGATIFQECPDFVEGFEPSKLAHKTCLENGTWYKHPDSNKEWSNYTSCIDHEELSFRTMINNWYIRGYTVSLITLIISLTIFASFKSLWCTRIKIHIQLFVSLSFTCIVWIIWYKFIVQKPYTIFEYPRLCVIWHIVIYYFMLTNYFWVFCEGLHLHLALVVVFVKDTIAIRWFLVIGWIFPTIYIAFYSVFLFYFTPGHPKCGIENEDAIWILAVPVCMSLLASFVFLVNVLRVLLSKMQPQSTQPPPIGIRRAIRATIILIPLFGLQHTLIPFRPSINAPYEKYYQIVSVFLVSLQGFFVSSLYCFANQDVIFAFHVFLNRAMPSVIPPVPSSVYTGTGGIATNTPSHAEMPL